MSTSPHSTSVTSVKYIPLLCLLLSLAIALFFYNLWLPSIWNPNEAFYAEGAREMLETGNFLVPHFNYEPRFQKPVLVYWLIAFVYHFFGVTEFTARLVSSLLASATTFITFLLGKLLFNTRTGLLSAIVLATSFEFNQQARYMSPEMTLLFFITLSLYAFILVLKKRSTGWLFIGYLSLALAVLTKGPVGFVLPMIIIVLYIALARDVKKIAALKLHYGLLLVIVVALPWFIFMYYTFGQQYLSVVWGENVKRFAGDYGKSSNIFYYFSVLPWNYLPWSPFFIIACISSVKRAVKKQVNPEILFILSWFVAVFSFFSISQGKLPPYLLPLFPAASVLVGQYFDEIIQKPVDSRKGLLVLTYLILFFVMLAYVALHMTLYLPWYALVLWLSLFLFLFLIILRNLNTLTIFCSLASGLLLFYFFFLNFVLPAVEMHREPYRILGSITRQHDPYNNVEFIAFGYSPQNLSFYVRRKVVKSRETKSVELYESSQPKFLMIPSRQYNDLNENVKKACELLYEFELYTKSESRFLSFLKSLKMRKDFDSFFLLSCYNESSTVR